MPLLVRPGHSSTQRTLSLRENINDSNSERGLTWTIPGRAATLPICFMAGRKPPTPEDKNSVLGKGTQLIFNITFIHMFLACMKQGVVARTTRTTKEERTFGLKWEGGLMEKGAHVQKGSEATGIIITDILSASVHTMKRFLARTVLRNVKQLINALLPT